MGNKEKVYDDILDDLENEDRELSVHLVKRAFFLWEENAREKGLSVDTEDIEGLSNKRTMSFLYYLGKAEEEIRKEAMEMYNNHIGESEEKNEE